MKTRDRGMRRILMPGIHLFDGYLGRREVEAIQGEIEQLGGLVKQFIDCTVREQAPRLRIIRGRGLWNVERAQAIEEQAQRAQAVLWRLRRVRHHEEHLRQLQAQLPSRQGLSRLRYANPWLVHGTLVGLIFTFSLAHGLRAFLAPG
ncbi:MAG: hypothetical protein HN712_12565 [Gemmatimonadetes bacterium]|jgi:hypothetical protein|nr:hypothetical protein [Gemmatimonadota bacterium]MBT6149669.1 hypothetical protein [Gemmatimonadota bacterium]MBT7861145.1 hypothetical protein [Gemmatimonadota bacterium]